ncbi:hypothetical protein CB1_000964012 [Camelus ferus]|nr:hypothetical protein CB1_000964012 [Camelus ferus]
MRILKHIFNDLEIQKRTELVRGHGQCTGAYRQIKAIPVDVTSVREGSEEEGLVNAVMLAGFTLTSCSSRIPQLPGPCIPALSQLHMVPGSSCCF